LHRRGIGLALVQGVVGQSNPGLLRLASEQLRFYVERLGTNDDWPPVARTSTSTWLGEKDAGAEACDREAGRTMQVGRRLPAPSGKRREWGGVAAQACEGQGSGDDGRTGDRVQSVGGERSNSGELGRRPTEEDGGGVVYERRRGDDGSGRAVETPRGRG
jgi:hypothetical protein